MNVGDDDAGLHAEEKSKDEPEVLEKEPSELEKASITEIVEGSPPYAGSLFFTAFLLRHLNLSYFVY